MIGPFTSLRPFSFLQPTLPLLAGWVCFFLALTPLSAQPDDLYFHHLGAAEGLSQSTNSCIYRDSSGFVWIGSAEGLNRFDGVQVRVYRANPDDPNQLADPTVTSPIFEDQRGDLWFATHSALHRYRRQYDDFERFVLPSPDGSALKGYQVFYLDRNETLWIQCNGQLYWFDTRQGQEPASKPFRPVSALEGTSFRFFETDPASGEGIVYAPAPDGLARYQYRQQALIALSPLLTGREEPAGGSVHDVYQETNGALWVACDSGLYYIRNGSPARRFYLFSSASIGSAHYLKAWDDDYLFVSTNHGLYLFDKAAQQFIRHWQSDERNPSALSNNNLTVLHLDYDQNLWVSAWTKGVDYTNLRKLKFQTRRYFTKNPGGKNSLFVPGPMLEDSHKRIWCGSQMNGLLALSADARQYEDFSDLAPAPDQMFEMDGENLLVNNFGRNLIKLFPQAHTAKPLLWKNTPVVRYHIARINANSFLLSSGYQQPGLLKLTIGADGYSFHPVGTGAVTQKDWLYVICLSEHEFLLADENYAVFYYREQPAPFLQYVTTLPGYINCSMENDSGVWLGGSFGLCQIGRSGRAYQYITTRDSLPDNMVYAIQPQTPGEWWLSTGKGLVRFDPEHLQFQKFGLADGLQAYEYNRRSCLKTSDGTLWFGGIGGYNIFRPEDIQPLNVPPKIQVVDLQVNDGPYPYADNPTQLKYLRLPFDSATLTFHFVALEFSDPAGNLLKYRLDYMDGKPYDRDWVNCPDAKGFARYANLPPGRYVLRILAANSDAIWSNEPKKLFIEITPPYYQTWWFRTILILAGMFLFYAVYRSRLIAMRKKEEHKRKITELELNALRAQLNPHFISNNLISINSYLRNNSVEKVRGYVATFARLMRNILESARNPVVPLAEELQMLQNFVEVESGRFPQPIDFSVSVKAGLDTTQLYLPGMLLQPFVENAILHGLAPRNGQGKISVQVAREQNILVLVVEDDGVGRNQTFPQKAADRKSHGLDITRERLHLYDLQHSTNSSLSIVDLKKEDDTSAGTRVILRLGLSGT